QHALWVFSLMGAFIAASLIWVFLLRQRVAVQTSLIRRRLESEAALESRYRRLFDRMSQPVFIFDAGTHRFLDCNQTAVTTYGYTMEDLKAMTPFDMHLSEDLPRARQTLFSANPGQPNLYTHLTKHGQKLEVEAMTDEIEYQGRSAWMTIVHNVTRQKQFERELLHA